MLLLILPTFLIPQVFSDNSDQPNIIWNMSAIYFSNTHTENWSDSGSDSWDYTMELEINDTKYYVKVYEMCNWTFSAVHNAYITMLMCDYDHSLFPAIPFLGNNMNVGGPPDQETARLLSLYMTGDEIDTEFSIYQNDCINTWNWSRTVMWYDENMTQTKKPNLSKFEWYQGEWEDDSESFNWSWTIFGWELMQHVPTLESTSNMLVTQEINWKDIGISLYNDTNGNKYPDIILDTVTWENNETEPILNSSELKYIFFVRDANIDIITPVVYGNSINFGAIFDLNGSWLQIERGSGLLWQWYHDYNSTINANIENYSVTFTATLTPNALKIKQNLGIEKISALPKDGLSLSFLQSFSVAESRITYNAVNEGGSNNLQENIQESDECDSFHIDFNSGTSTKVQLDITGVNYQLGNNEYELIGSQLPIGQFTGVFTGSNINVGTDSGSLYIISIGCPIYDKNLQLIIDPKLTTSFSASFPVIYVIIFGVPTALSITIILAYIYIRKKRKHKKII